MIVTGDMDSLEKFHNAHIGNTVDDLPICHISSDCNCVLIAFRDDITAESLDNLNSNCEIVWTKIHFARNKSIFFASYYRLPSDHLASLEALQASLTKRYRSHKNTPNVVIAGDFNLPDIDWNSQQTTNIRTASKHNKVETTRNNQ